MHETMHETIPEMKPVLTLNKLIYVGFAVLELRIKLMVNV